jgi:hypothetical protein
LQKQNRRSAVVGYIGAVDLILAPHILGPLGNSFVMRSNPPRDRVQRTFLMESEWFTTFDAHDAAC